MKVKHDDALIYLRNFGFVCQEHTTEGFIRYNKTIGKLIVTVANGQFENKVRVSLCQDRDGHIQTNYKDILVYTDLICLLHDAGLFDEAIPIDLDILEEALVQDEMENPLLSFPRKPEGFMG